MTLILVEGFDYLNDIDEKYIESADASIALSSTTRHGVGYSARSTNTAYFSVPCPGLSDTVIYFGFAYMQNVNLYSGPLVIINVNNTADFKLSTVGIGLDIYSGAFYRGSLDRKFFPNVWYYIEVKYTATESSSSGDVKVRVNEEELYSCGAGEDWLVSGGTYIQYLRFYGLTTGGGYTYFDDIYICNNSGSKNNSFLGDSKVDWLMPNGNGNTNQFVGSDADSINNYLHVDEIGPDENTTYVESSTVSQLDQYAMDDLAETPVTIHGVSVSARIRKDDAGSRTSKIVLRSGSTDYEGSELFPSTNFEYFDEIWEDDPATATAWTETGINAAQAGIKVES